MATTPSYGDAGAYDAERRETLRSVGQATEPSVGEDATPGCHDECGTGGLKMEGFLGDAWPVLATVALGLLFASALTVRQERGRSKSSSEELCRTAIRDYSRLLAAAAGRKAMGGRIDESVRAQKQLCPFLLKMVDAADSLPKWKRRLIWEQLVDLAGEEPFVARLLGCGSSSEEERDFWTSVYQQIRLTEKVPLEDQKQMSDRSNRFYAAEDFDGALMKMDPLRTTVDLVSWNVRARRSLRPELPDTVRELIARRAL